MVLSACPATLPSDGEAERETRACVALVQASRIINMLFPTTRKRTDIYEPAELVVIIIVDIFNLRKGSD